MDEREPLVYRVVHEDAVRPATRAATLAAFGGCVCGFDTGAISGVISLTTFKTQFLGTDPATVAYRQGILVATFLCMAALGAFRSGQACDRHGRRQTMLLATLLFGAGLVCQVIASGFELFLVGRLLGGYGAGLLTNVVPLYQAEIAPAALRGRLMSLFTLLGLIGQMAGCVVTHVTSTWFASTWSWRLVWLIHLMLLCLFGIIVYGWLPCSPRWLISKGMTRQGLQTLAQLRHGSLVMSHDVLQEYTGILDTLKHQEEASCSFADLFSRSYRRRTWTALGIALATALTGNETLDYFMPPIFQRAGLEKSSLMIAGGTNMVALVFSVLAFACIDRWGRRILFAIGSAVMAPCMFIIGLGFSNSTHQLNMLIIVAVIIFRAAFTFSWGVTNYVYIAEVFDTSSRAKGIALAYALNWVTCIVIAFVSPLVMVSSLPVLFLFYAAMNVAGLVGIGFIPETKAKTLEEMDTVFGTGKKQDSVPT